MRVAARQLLEDVVELLLAARAENDRNSNGIARHDGQVLTQQVDGAASIGVGYSRYHLHVVTLPCTKRRRGTGRLRAVERGEVSSSQREARVCEHCEPKICCQKRLVQIVPLSAPVPSGRFGCCRELAPMVLFRARRGRAEPRSFIARGFGPVWHEDSMRLRADVRLRCR